MEVVVEEVDTKEEVISPENQLGVVDRTIEDTSLRADATAASILGLFRDYIEGKTQEPPDPQMLEMALQRVLEATHDLRLLQQFLRQYYKDPNQKFRIDQRYMSSDNPILDLRGLEGSNLPAIEPAKKPRTILDLAEKINKNK